MESLFNLKNKVIVITGGLGQLGQQFGSAVVQHGGKVAIIDTASEPKIVLPEFAAALNDPSRVRIYKCDITKKQELEICTQKIQEQLGPIFGLVNNAALDSPPNASHEENGPFETYPEASLRKVIDVNILGTTFCCQVIGSEMVKNGGGSIINIASIYGLVSPNQDIYEFKRKENKDWYKPVAYSISKSSIYNLTRYLATYWAKKKVRVNTLTPAGIFNNQDSTFLSEYTKRMPMGRMAEAHELNGDIVYLLSDASTYMTGSNMTIDGGWTAW